MADPDDPTYDTYSTRPPPPPPTAPDPPDAVAPSVAPEPTAVEVGTDLPPNARSAAARARLVASPRYAYLSGRLRNKQITMEEATELFGILQSVIVTIPIGPVGSAAPGRPMGQPAARPRPPAGPGRLSAVTDEDVGLALVALGAGAGLVAAILKRSAEGPRSDRPPPR